MTIRDVPIEELSTQDLKEQIERGVRELRIVDYKAKLPGNSDGEKKEFLKDVCSFANAGGGDLVYGMIEVEGVPTELCGADLDNPDAEVLRLENVIRDGLDPRLIGFSSQPMELEDGHFALVIRVPRSVRRLHAVNYKGHWRFYSRNSAGKYPMDVSEVRDAFAFSESLATRMRDFRAERLSGVISEQSPISMEGAAATVLHIMPLSAFDTPGQRLDLTPSLRGANRLNPIQLGGQPSYNFDGVLSSGRYGDWREAGPQSYALMFHSGVVEAADSELLWPQYEERWRTDKIIPAHLYEKEILDSVDSYLKLTSEIGVEGPVFVSLSLLGVQGYVIPHELPSRSKPIDQDSLQIPEVMAHSPRLEREDVELLMRPVFDAFWNACGFSGSPYYDGMGRWVGK